MPRQRGYARGERLAGVVFVAALGVALLAAAFAFAASGRWEVAVLVGGGLVLVAFFGGVVVAAIHARRHR